MKKIPLTQGKVALVNNEDYEWLNQWKWYAHYDGWNWYAIRTTYSKGGIKNRKCTNIFMHRLIMRVKKGQEIDHRNGNGLDNRKSNLRICYHHKNVMNSRSYLGSSQYKGVCWYKKGKKWKSQIHFNFKPYHLGYFNNEIDAASAYDRKAKELFGEFAQLNFT